MNNILQHRHGVVRKHKYKHKKAILRRWRVVCLRLFVFMSPRLHQGDRQTPAHQGTSPAAEYMQHEWLASLLF